MFAFFSEPSKLYVRRHPGTFYAAWYDRFFVSSSLFPRNTIGPKLIFYSFTSFMRRLNLQMKHFDWFPLPNRASCQVIYCSITTGYRTRRIPLLEDYLWFYNNHSRYYNSREKGSGPCMYLTHDISHFCFVAWEF